MYVRGLISDVRGDQRRLGGWELRVRSSRDVGRPGTGTQSSTMNTDWRDNLESEHDGKTSDGLFNYI